MNREISQRELRNESGAIMRELENGQTFTVTRNGVPIAELVPLRRRRFVRAVEAIERFADAPPLDYVSLREDLDRMADQDAAPRV